MTGAGRVLPGCSAERPGPSWSRSPEWNRPWLAGAAPSPCASGSPAGTSPARPGPGPSWNWDYYMSLVRSCASSRAEGVARATSFQPSELDGAAKGPLVFGDQNPNVALLFFSADFKTVTTDVSMQTFKIAGLIVSVPRLVGLGAMVATSLVLYLFFMHTDLGRAVRATGQDREVARLMGINDFRIYGVAYGLSAAMMGIAAAVLVPFFYIHPGVGTSFLLKAFVIVVLGGLGSMPGAALGGLLVGVIEGAVALWVQAAVAQIVLFAVFVAILFVRPAGLLGVERR